MHLCYVPHNCRALMRGPPVEQHVYLQSFQRCLGISKGQFCNSMMEHLVRQAMMLQLQYDYTSLVAASHSIVHAMTAQIPHGI